ncbi:MAG TPA: succinate dehydrogenase, hydrophobic membrane anchor protein [Woeseiaceae bacterium]
MKSLRSPLGRVLGSGSAKEGTGHWWSQRVSAVALLLLGAWFLCSLQFLPDLGHATVVSWLARPWNAVLMILLVTTVAVHSDLGVRVVVEDYMRQPFARTVTLIVLRFAHVLVAAVAAFAVLSIAFGAAG